MSKWLKVWKVDGNDTLFEILFEILITFSVIHRKLAENLDAKI